MYISLGYMLFLYQETDTTKISFNMINVGPTEKIKYKTMYLINTSGSADPIWNDCILFQIEPVVL